MASEQMRMSKAATDLVFRARHGDQNAMGMIAEVRKAAQNPGKINMRARVAYGMIKEAIKRNPATMGAESNPAPPKTSEFPKGLLTGLIMPGTFFECFKAFQHVQNGMVIVCTMLTFGPLLTRQQIAEFCVDVPNDAQGRMALIALEKARRVQAVRNPRIPCAVLSPMIAWEMGE